MSLEFAVRTKKVILIAVVAAAAAALLIVVATESIHIPRGSSQGTRTVDDSAFEWEETASSEWGFSALLPRPVEHKKTSVETPFGDAPLESFAGSVGAARFTVAVSEYDPQVTIEFTEDQRYESSDPATPKLLGGNLVHSAPIRQHGIEGREQIIEVPGEAILHTRMFLIGNRSYQIQVAYPSDSPLDSTVKNNFFDSLSIEYRSNGE
jgi:hypothetical protein